MSGTKTFTITAGVSSSVAIAGLAVVGTAGAIHLTSQALQAYQERRQRQQEAAIQKEAAVQERIAQILAKKGQAKVIVKLPESMPTADKGLSKDIQKQVEALKSKLPQIESEYQTLVAQQLMDAQTVQQALAEVAQALHGNELALAQAHLQALDDARIQVMQGLQAGRIPQIQYLQTRFEEVRSCLPQAVIQDLQNRIANFHSNKQQFTDAQLQQIHADINDLAAQAEQIQSAADNLVNSWLEVGYDAQILGVDDGDVVIEIATHDGANTQIRVQFSGQQIDLFAPPEETESCTERTFAALRLFQEQGYQLEWTSWDGQETPEEWRHLSALKRNYEPQNASQRWQAQEY